MPLVKRKILVFIITLMLCVGGSVSAFASFQRGDDGQEVLAIQKRLVELSYTITNLDGDFGRKQRLLSESSRQIEVWRLMESLVPLHTRPL